MRATWEWGHQIPRREGKKENRAHKWHPEPISVLESWSFNLLGEEMELCPAFQERAQIQLPWGLLGGHSTWQKQPLSSHRCVQTGSWALHRPEEPPMCSFLGGQRLLLSGMDSVRLDPQKQKQDSYSGVQRHWESAARRAERRPLSPEQPGRGDPWCRF